MIFYETFYFSNLGYFQKKLYSFQYFQYFTTQKNSYFNVEFIKNPISIYWFLLRKSYIIVIYSCKRI